MSATPAAVVIVDAAGNPSVVLDSKFRAGLTAGEHVLFARGPEAGEYICKCGIRVVPHRCKTDVEF